MPVEVEAKFRVDAAVARRRLEQAGVRLEGPEQQDDTFFDTPAGALRAQGVALRVRRTVAGWTLTAKGARVPGPAKARAEHEAPCLADPAPLLGLLGYVLGLRVAKRRWCGTLEGATVTLDEVAGLGWFVEVEVVVRSEAELGAARQAVAAVARRLGLAPEDEEQRSYAELMAGAT